jgi:hypothetical protein
MSTTAAFGQAYSYTILRYVHDIVTGEFVNVGVILRVPSANVIDVRVRKTIGRMRKLFPDLDRENFTRTMHAVQRSIFDLRRRLEKEPLLASNDDAATIIKKVLPLDDSSLQWSTPVGTGLTDNPAKTIERLFERFVSRYDIRSTRRRTDDEVWQPVRQRLIERDLATVLQEATIQGEVDEIIFKHAWKNGIWHVYEPLSFDLADADGIKTKAREWRGHLAAVTDGAANEPFKPHFIVGAPSNPALERHYKAALGILRNASIEPVIFEEHQIDEVVAQIEDDVRAHVDDNSTPYRQ